jgi:hypothetical protein
MERDEGEALPILFTGSIDAGVGKAEGLWESGEQAGEWRGERHAGEVPESPAFDLATSGLWMHYDLLAAIHTSDQNASIVGNQMQMDVTTNIAAGSVVVQRPDGSELILDATTDIFSPGVDFVAEFRFAANIEGQPDEGDYVFRFLDPVGEPLRGIEGRDVWSGCEALAALNVQAAVEAGGLRTSWSPVPGFNPIDSEGFYQIEIGPDSGEGKGYGANHIQQRSHFIPFAPFVPGASGSPDGQDYGVGLGEFADGSYSMVIYVFYPASAAPGGVGFECQLSAEDEILTLEKQGGEFSITK